MRLHDLDDFDGRRLREGRTCFCDFCKAVENVLIMFRV